MPAIELASAEARRSPWRFAAVLLALTVGVALPGCAHDVILGEYKEAPSDSAGGGTPQADSGEPGEDEDRSGHSGGEEGPDADGNQGPGDADDDSNSGAVGFPNGSGGP
jgi:hypothetical protein